MRIKEVENKLNWALDRESAIDKRVDSDEFVKLIVNVPDVFRNAEKSVSFDLDDPTGGENVKDFRLQGAKDHFRAGNPMDLPVLAASEWSDDIGIENGRHRMYAAYQMGHEYVPALVWKQNLAKFKEKVRTKDM